MSPTPGRVTAALVAVLLLAASCGTSDGAESEAGIATLSDPSIAAAGSQPVDDNGSDDLEAPENPDDALLLYDRCMANEGFDFQTAGGASQGELSVEPSGSEDGSTRSDPQSEEQSSADFDFDKFIEADDKCTPHLRNLDSEFDLTPEQEAAFADAELKWRECMTDQGVDVPDFGDGDGLIAIGGLPDENDPQDGGDLDDENFDFEAFDKASEQCQSIFDEVQNTEGASSGSDR